MSRQWPPCERWVNSLFYRPHRSHLCCTEKLGGTWGLSLSSLSYSVGWSRWRALQSNRSLSNTQYQTSPFPLYLLQNRRRKRRKIKGCIVARYSLWWHWQHCQRRNEDRRVAYLKAFPLVLTQTQKGDPWTRDAVSGKRIWFLCTAKCSAINDYGEY